MTVHVHWENIEEHPIAIYQFDGLWDWDDLQAAHTVAFKTIREQTKTVSVVFDMTASVDLPVGALSAMRQMLAYAPPNLGVIVVLTDDAVTHTTFAMLSKFDQTLSSRIVTVPDTEGAYSILKEYHLTLD